MKILSPVLTVLPILEEISGCRQCAENLPHSPRPVVTAGDSARLLIIGQAPGRRVHDTGIPWNDASGTLLREWLQTPPDLFYDAGQVAIVPMGLCYPGSGPHGDLPPRPECAPRWHAPLRAAMPHIRLTLLIGRYAQAAYLPSAKAAGLTATVAEFERFLPAFFPLPHPSPRNRLWLRRHPWFTTQVLPRLRQEVARALDSNEP